MKEIPISKVRMNQWGIVLFVLLSIFLQSPWFIVGLLVIQGIGFVGGIKWNLFIRLTEPLQRKKEGKEKTESAELQRFNNGIALFLLTVSVLFFGIGWELAGYITALMVSVAAFVAICGFCIGCVIYFQFKQWKALRGISLKK
ncbi:MAG TPA: DUF4395 domain-containing protein [Paenibacillaceae bacterium]|nr:DUF4395 domain-containing protein [Paenibacillaceae bacterium]